MENRDKSKKPWWTGEDSNLRSSKERQVYSLLPLTARPPVHKSAVGSCAPDGPSVRQSKKAAHTCVRAVSTALREASLRSLEELRAATVTNSLAPPPCAWVPASGAGEGIRTPDPLITNQMLYQLSYASKYKYLPTTGDKAERLPQRHSTCKQSSRFTHQSLPTLTPCNGFVGIRSRTSLRRRRGTQVQNLLYRKQVCWSSRRIVFQFVSFSVSEYFGAANAIN
jgi:hypothetical protein